MSGKWSPWLFIFCVGYIAELSSCDADKSKEENASEAEEDNDDDEKDVDDEEDVLDDESEEYLAKLEKVPLIFLLMMLLGHSTPQGVGAQLLMLLF